MPQRKLGARPCLSSLSLPPPPVALVCITFRRSAEVSPVFRLKSPVKRMKSPLPSVKLTSLALARTGCLLTWLTTPPVEPRPNSIEAEPRSSSTRSKLKVSRS